MPSSIVSLHDDKTDTISCKIRHLTTDLANSAQIPILRSYPLPSFFCPNTYFALLSPAVIFLPKDLFCALIPCRHFSAQRPILRSYPLPSFFCPKTYFALKSPAVIFLPKDLFCALIPCRHFSAQRPILRSYPLPSFFCPKTYFALYSNSLPSFFFINNYPTA